MTYNILATGSSGNAVIINDSILIDCGVPFKTLEPFVKDLRLVLLTHEHSDHFKPSTVKKLHKLRPALRFGCCEWMVRPLLEAGVDKRVIDVYKVDLMKAYDGLAAIIPVSIPHDVPNCGYKILTERKSVLETSHDGSIFYSTDCATLDGIEAKFYELYMIEANHTQEEIDARISAKLAAGEYPYELEAKRNHLSQEQAMDWLAKNMGPHSKYVFLHQHKDKERSKIDD